MYPEEVGHIWKEYYNDFTRECDTHLMQRMKEFYEYGQKTYILIDTVSDVTEYQYIITDDFNKKYIKVSLTTNYGEIVESIPFIVEKSGEGYTTNYVDTDEDGLPDVLEIQIGTNISLQDTDEDGLTDYQEVYVTKTDPLVWDSVQSGTSDTEADIDSYSL